MKRLGEKDASLLSTGTVDKIIDDNISQLPGVFSLLD